MTKGGTTLAYYDMVKVTAIKSFIVQAFGVILIKLCTKTRVFVADNMIFKIKAGVYPCEPPLDGPFYEGQIPDTSNGPLASMLFLSFFNYFEVKHAEVFVSDM